MIPCIECITYAICKRKSSIVSLVETCSILSESIKSLDDAIDAIYTIEPPYFSSCTRGGITLTVNAEAILKAAYMEQRK